MTQTERPIRTNSRKNSSETKSELRVVDLFCGCGGLALGFALHRGDLKFRTVLGVDNDVAATKVFNDNFRPEEGSRLAIGRLADVTWFSHPDEIRLFYLAHITETERLSDVRGELADIGFPRFLEELKALDDEFSLALSDLNSRDDFSNDAEQIPLQASTLALVRSFAGRLGITNFRRPVIDLGKLPWTEEYRCLTDEAVPRRLLTQRPAIADLAKSVASQWDESVEQLTEASGKSGRGQHAKNSERLKALTIFLQSASGRKLRSHWVGWKAARDSLRARFCLENREAIRSLYFARARAHVILGGPPCKGFSRIGRPVIESLRDQGAHAWSHKEFGDERNSLMIQYVLFLEALQPDVFLFENVSNFQSALKTPNGCLNAPDMLVQLLEDLSAGEVHYHVKHELVNARHFSVPQDRRRFIMFGLNAAKAVSKPARAFFEFGAPAQDVPLSQALLGLGEPSVFDPQGGVKADHLTATSYLVTTAHQPKSYSRYMRWIATAKPGTADRPTETDAHIYRQGREDDVAFIRFIGPGIRWMDLKVGKSPTLAELQDVLAGLVDASTDKQLRNRAAELLKKVDDSLMLRLLLEHTVAKGRLSEQHLLLDSYLKNGGSTHGDWLERLSASKPCRTIVAHIGKDTYAYWHPFEPRALTIREAARVQSFPDFFKFGADGVVDAYSVIGNAVPPLLANSFARRIEELHEEYCIFHDEVLESMEAPSRHEVQLVLTI